MKGQSLDRRKARPSSSSLSVPDATTTSTIGSPANGWEHPVDTGSWTNQRLSYTSNAIDRVGSETLEARSSPLWSTLFGWYSRPQSLLPSPAATVTRQSKAHRDVLELVAMEQGIESSGIDIDRVSLEILQKARCNADTDTRNVANTSASEDFFGYDDVDLASEESLASSEDNDDTHLLIESPTVEELRKSVLLRRRSRILPEVGDLETYSAQRQMTATQERWNALTMLPSPCFCMFYLLSGAWIRNYEAPYTANSFDDIDLTKCLLPSSSWWHNMPSLPPIPVVCVALGITLHAPFSILYHWRYAHRLSGLARTTHWSRRLDQIMIHVASTALTYASSGSWDLLVANVLFNADCVYRQCMPVVEPRRNQMRITISILAYLIPILHRGLVLCFVKLLCLGMIGFWLFTRYPIGGWSHAVFHLVMGLSPPLVMEVALTLEASQPAMQQAAACVANY
jgi:hypothetical protein